MRDKLLDLGSVTLASSAAYSANTLDLGEGIKDNYFGFDTPAVVVFTATAAVSNFVPTIYSGTSASPTAVYGCGPTVSAMAIGDTVKVPMPVKVDRYVRAGGTGTGTVTAHIELGGAEA